MEIWIANASWDKLLVDVLNRMLNEKQSTSSLMKAEARFVVVYTLDG